MNQFKYAEFLGFRLWLVVLLSIGLGCPDFAAAAWERVATAPAAEEVISLAPCAERGNCFYAATPYAVFQNENGAWKLVFSLSAANEKITRVDLFPSNTLLWIQTGQSVYRQNLHNQNDERVYSSRDPAQQVLAFCAGKETLWLGTPSGIWSSLDEGRTWQKNSSLSRSEPVPLIFESSIGLFFSTQGQLKLAEAGAAQTVLTFFDYSAPEEADALSSNEGDSDQPLFNQVFFDLIETDEMFYAASSKGVYESQNGWDWKALSNSGLQDTVFSRVFWNRHLKQLGGFTESGFYVFDSANKQWRSYNAGLAKTAVNALLPSPAENWILANSEGLWAQRPEKSFAALTDDKALLFNRVIKLEPSIQEIHKQAIRYSGTSNSKIKRWHFESRLAALAPSFSLGKDWGTSNNVDLDRAGTNDPDRFIDGPWDKDRGVDFDLSWDLGDLIFSSSQTSIDSRAKLLTDQRNDLLAEATRIFFERRRLQAEMLHAPAPDQKAHFEQLLRIEELTALIDALTGGYLSKQLERIYRLNPELEEIWRYQTQGH